MRRFSFSSFVPPLAVLVLGVALLTATATRAQFSLLSLKNSLVQFALSQISVEGEFEITAREVVEPEDGATELVGIEIADGDGVWLRAEAFSIRWNASRILSGELDLENLTIRGLEVLRQPTPPEVTIKPGSELDSAPSRGLFDWPRSPLTLRVGAMRVERAFIAAGVLAEQSLSFEADGAAQDEGAVQALTLAIRRTDATTGAIRLDYARNFETNTLRLTLDANEAAGGLVAEMIGLPEDSASRILVDADGPLTDWRLALEAEAEAVLSAGATATVHADAPIAIVADARIRPGPKLAPDIAAALGAEARLLLSVEEDDGGLIAIRQARLATPALDAEMTGQYARASGALDGALRLEAGPALARAIDGVDFARIRFDGRVSGAVPDIDASGALAISGLATEPADIRAATLSLDFSRRGARIDATIDGEADGLRLDQLDAETVGAATLSARATYDDDALRLDHLRLASPLLTAEIAGDADLAEERLAFSYNLAAPRLAPIAAAYGAEVSGAIDARGALSGPIDAPQLDGDARVNGMVVADARLGDPHLRHELTLGDVPRGVIRLESEAETLGPIRAAADFVSTPDRLRFETLDLSALGIDATGQAEVFSANGLVSGDLAIAAPDLGRLSALLDAPVAGKASGAVRLTPADGRQRLAATLDVTGLRLPDLAAGAATLTAESGDLLNDGAIVYRIDARALETADARIGSLVADGRFEPAPDRLAATIAARGLDADPLVLGRVDGTVTLDAVSGDPRIDAALTGRDGALADTRLDRVDLTAKGALDALALSLRAEGADPRQGAVRATVDARGAVAGAPLDLTVSKAQVALGDSVIALRRPLTIADSNGGLRVAPIDLEAPGATLTGDAWIGESGLTASLALDARRLEALAPLAGLPIEAGRLAAELSVDTRRASAAARLTARARDLVLSDIDATDAALSISVDGVWDGARARAETTVSGPFDEPLKADFAIDLPAGGLVPTPADDAAIAGSARWQGRIEQIWGLLPFPDHVLSGALDANLRISGRLDAPKPAGAFTVTDGAYQFLETGTILSDLTAATTLDPDGALALDIKATDGAGAPITARARIVGDSVDAALATREAVLVRRDDAVAALSLDITAQGPLVAPRIAGAVTIDRAELRLLDASAPSVADLGPVEIAGQPARQAEAADGGAVDARGPTLDLTVTAPGRIFVRGRGLTSEWRAGLTVRGRAAAPRIEGSVEKLQGELDFIGRRFDLTTGAVTFLGAVPPNPTLDIELEHERDDLLGRIAISGTATTPELAFESEPALPEDEVLPRLLFDKSRQSLTPEQAFELASGLATLLSGREGVLGRVRSATGLDVLSVDRDGDSTALRAGRRVADGVFVGVRQPIDGTGSSVEVEAEIFEGVTVDSEVKPQGGSSFGLNYRFDF